MKFLLYPFSWLYGLITSIRNYFYDIGHYKSIRFSVNVISVGNLAVGGTGKSPMVEYLIRLLTKHDHKPAILSRGYKRKTKGFRLAGAKDNASTLGDEPFQFWLKFDKKVPVAIGEERIFAIPELLYQHEDRDVIVCDDAYQHRSLSPNFNILLSTFENPFFNDKMMPVGKLREARKGAKRADVVIFTKCPSDIGDKKSAFISKAREYVSDGCSIFFSTIKYSRPIPIFDQQSVSLSKVLLLTGLANAKVMKHYVLETYDMVEHLEYSDHHHYTEKDTNTIIDRFRYLQEQHNDLVVLTTEKDAAKIQDIRAFSALPVFYLPIEIEFLYEGDQFDRLVLDSFKKIEAI